MTKEEARIIGKVLAGTTITKAMIDDMMLAAIRGEAIHTYFDGEAVHVERVEIRDIFREETARIEAEKETPK